ncbi:hypothetical protein AVEN_245915-1 [Araneus ventricosus]|uniref:Uncharacterized protein n=1 Tax=Araneus ventricosus TaxID=182803 RepID=A0A4Y2NAY1_ARAVE|nr:hypothetical protein AVEN_245915-1 [Araneus ventricosus]
MVFSAATLTHKSPPPLHPLLQLMRVESFWIITIHSKSLHPLLSPWKRAIRGTGGEPGFWGARIRLPCRIFRPVVPTIHVRRVHTTAT